MRGLTWNNIIQIEGQKSIQNDIDEQHYHLSRDRESSLVDCFKCQPSMQDIQRQSLQYANLCDRSREKNNKNNKRGLECIII